jgi:predicted ATPase
VIDKLVITNFKAFSSAHIPLAPYTLLSGLNSSGKSTVIQALALLRQAENSGLLVDYSEYDEDGLIGGLPLNGELVDLGTGQDVLHEDYIAEQGKAPEIGFELVAGTMAPLRVRARYGREDDLLTLTLCEPPPHIRSERREEEAVYSLFNPGFQYLRADRIIPAVTYPRSHEMAVRRGFLGTRGEFTIDYLRHNQDEVVPYAALHHPAASSRLLDQVEAWMGEICPGVKIETAAIEQTDLVRLGFEFTRAKKLTTNLRRPTNVGFGLTYVLPVVVACLTAGPGAMILLENPEAHVHPQGQSAMARLTCAAAAAGAQLIVETHSDHILNGVRLAVKHEHLSASDVRLHYFQRGADGTIDIISPSIGPDGMVSQWPPGFFDEWDRSLDQLLD